MLICIVSFLFTEEAELFGWSGAPNTWTGHGLGLTPLHYAAYNGHVDVCKALLSHIDDNCPNPRDSARFGITPLHLAIWSDHLPVIQLLADRLKRSKAMEAGLLSILYRHNSSRGAREILGRAEDIWRLQNDGPLEDRNLEEEEEEEVKVGNGQSARRASV